MAAPKKISTLLYPVSHKDVSKKDPLLFGAAGVKLKTKESDLEIYIWHHRNKYSMEIKIDVQHVNQSLLPVDESGNLITAKLSALPWIKIYWPGLGPVTIDVKCDSKTKKCVGLWANCPYNPAKETAFKVEANLRGLEGKLWSPRINIHALYSAATREMGIESKVLSPVYAIQPGASAARVRVRKHFDLQTLPREVGRFKLLRILEWIFYNTEKLSESGFVRTLNPTLFTLDEGSALLQVLEDKSLQTIEMKAGDAFWAPNSTTLSFASKKTSHSDQALFRILEFSRNNP